jgi:hypothetical protein
MNYDRHIRQVGTAWVRSEERRRSPLSKQEYLNNGDSLLLCCGSIRHGENWVVVWWLVVVSTGCLNFTCILLVEQVCHEKDWLEAVSRRESEYS